MADSEAEPVDLDETEPPDDDDDDDDDEAETSGLEVETGGGKKSLVWTFFSKPPEYVKAPSRTNT